MPFHEFRSARFEREAPSVFHVLYGKPVRRAAGAEAAASDARDERAARAQFPDEWKSAPVTRVSQVHGVDLCAAPCDTAPEADGLVCSEPGTLLRIVVADCMPVFFLDPARGRTALVHAGWRGLAAGILDRAIETLAAAGSPARDLSIWIGPHIGPDSYEVGPEVLAAFGRTPAVSREGDGDRAWLDLHATARGTLEAAGVPTGAVHERPPCTLRDERLFSHRRGDTGRNVAYFGVA